MQPAPPPNALNQLMQQASIRAAAALSEMLNLPVSVELSKADLLDWEAVISHVRQESPNWGASVFIHFQGAANGESIFLLPKGGDTALVASLFEQNPDLAEMENAHQAVLCEVGNVLLNACVGTIANQLGKQVTYQTPELIEPAQIQHLLENSQARKSPILWLMSSLGVGGLKVSATILLLVYEEIQL